MDRKAKYIEFCEKHYVPLMFRPWWLDAVCPNEWDVCVSFDKGGAVTGVLVYHLTRYKGFPIIKMPPLTDYSGPWLQYPDNLDKLTSRYGFEKEVFTKLIKQLPTNAFFYQQWGPFIQNWLPFYWQEFRQTTLYTFRLNLTNEIDLFKNLKRTARKNIRRALQTIQVETSDDLDELYNIATLSFERQQIRPTYSFDTFYRLDQNLKERNLRTIYLARDSVDRIHAGAYLVWDEKCAYYLVSGGDPALRESQAQYLIQWHAILDCLGRTEFFDFCGSTLEPVERALRTFGGELMPHFKVFKAKNKVLQMLSILLNKDFY